MESKKAAVSRPVSASKLAATGYGTDRSDNSWPPPTLRDIHCIDNMISDHSRLSVETFSVVNGLSGPFTAYL